MHERKQSNKENHLANLSAIWFSDNEIEDYAQHYFNINYYNKYYEKTNTACHLFLSRLKRNPIVWKSCHLADNLEKILSIASDNAWLESYSFINPPDFKYFPTYTRLFEYYRDILVFSFIEAYRKELIKQEEKEYPGNAPNGNIFSNQQILDGAEEILYFLQQFFGSQVDGEINSFDFALNATANKYCKNVKLCEQFMNELRQRIVEYNALNLILENHNLESYFIAQYIANFIQNKPEQGWSFIAKKVYDPLFENVWYFLAGFLGDSKQALTQTFYSVLSDAFSETSIETFEFLAKILAELGPISNLPASHYQHLTTLITAYLNQPISEETRLILFNLKSNLPKLTDTVLYSDKTAVEQNKTLFILLQTIDKLLFPEKDIADINSIFLNAVTDNNINNMRKAISRGADIHAKNSQGDTALHILARNYLKKRENYDALCFLLDQGTCILTENNEGKTVLDLAPMHSVLRAVLNAYINDKVEQNNLNPSNNQKESQVEKLVKFNIYSPPVIKANNRSENDNCIKENSSLLELK